MENQLSIYSLTPEVKEKDLIAINCKYLSTYDTNVDELFSGYDDLKVLTFSYGMSFVNKIVSQFKTVEIIIGSDKHAKYDMLEVMANQQDSAAPFLAHQGAVLRRIRRNRTLVDRINAGEISIYLAKEILAHEKMYILTSDEGKTRVIYGSANFSSAAFAGDKQRESILVFDDDIGAYNNALEEFDMVRDLSSQEVIKDAVYFSEDGKPKDESKEIQDIPIISNALTNKAGIILEPNNGTPEDVQFAIDVSTLTKRYSEVGIHKAEGKDGIITIRAQSVNELVRNYKKAVVEELAVRKQKPQFDVDVVNNRVSFNEKEFDLTPSSESVGADIGMLLSFFDGYNLFLGDADSARRSYYLLLNYMFLTPFIGQLRSVAFKHRYTLVYYPLFAVLTGPKSSGKSSLVKTIHKLMFVKPIPSFSSDEWVKTVIKGLMHEVSEIPLLVDDLSSKRFKENVNDIVKEDEYINKEGLKKIPSFIITSNDINTSIEPALKKRMIYLTTDLKLDDVKAAYMSKSVSDGVSAICGAFYREYLRRAIIRVKELIELMNADKSEEQEWHPDLFKVSSEVINEIIGEYSDVPDYMKNVSFEDYFGIKTDMIKDIKETILTDYEHNKKAFTIDKKRNTLKYTPGERNYEAKRVCDALPEMLEAKVTQMSVIMRLDRAEEFFGISFKKGLFR